ncbi:MAG: cytochrome C [Planctomycetota bacterium]|nr:cytochrome C [Planctomycetota bacterium]
MKFGFAIPHLQVRAVALLAAAFLVGLAASGAARADETAAAENRRCLQCHGQPQIAELGPDDRAVMVAPMPEGFRPAAPIPRLRPGLHVDAEALRPSVHAALRCTDCHAEAVDLPHRRFLGEPTCSGACHDPAQSGYLRSAHAAAKARGMPDAPTCATCHGGHDVRAVGSREARTHPLNAVRICADCHQQHAAQTAETADTAGHIQAYLDSVHGQALTRSGLVIAATCADCHGHHEVLPSGNPAARTHRAQVPGTCGKCHLGIVEVFRDSVHGQRLEEGGGLAPVCTDCHAAHRITHASIQSAQLDIVAECGECHDRPELSGGRRASFYDTYRASYHGQVNELGSTRAARCSDCHGAHDILPIADENSRLHGEHRVETCRTCHEGANASFAQFDPHADYRDRERYPLLHGVWWYFIIMMSAAFGFFGLHSLLWFTRSLIERARFGPAPRFVANPHGIRRFTTMNRVNHALIIVTFFGLTLTGIPLLFSDQEWAKHLARVLGGVSAVGVWHRVFAVLLIGNFMLHFWGLARSARRHQGSILRTWLLGPNSMMPRRKDFADCAAMFRWFVRGGKKPAFDRWTYWEKFDYWAEIGGTLIIGGSGLLLWFPIFFSRFLPGWIFNVAMIVHGYEALLAMGFIFTIHFFNAHLRLEKFPVDDVIFTGQLPEEEFRHERGEEYARLAQSGELDALREAPAPGWQRFLAVGVGATAMAIGLTLVTLIILAGLQAL